MRTRNQLTVSLFGLLFAAVLLMSGCLTAVIVADTIEQTKLRNRMKDLNTETNWQKTNAPGDREKVSELKLKSITEFTRTYKKGKLKKEEVTTYEEFDRTGNRTELIIRDPMFGTFGYIGIYDNEGRLIKRLATIKGGKMQDKQGNFTEHTLAYLKKGLQDKKVFRKTLYFFTKPGDVTEPAKYDPDVKETRVVHQKLDAGGKLIRMTVHEIRRKRTASRKSVEYTELLARTQYKYDESGRLLQALSYDSEDEIILNTEFKYDGESDVVVERKQFEPKSLSLSISKYKDGRLAEMKSQSSEHKFEGEYVYDDQEKLIKIVWTSQRFSEINRDAMPNLTVITYNDKGLKTGSENYQEDQIHQSTKLEYQYFDPS